MRETTTWAQSMSIGMGGRTTGCGISSPMSAFNFLFLLTSAAGLRNMTLLRCHWQRNYASV